MESAALLKLIAAHGGIERCRIGERTMSADAVSKVSWWAGAEVYRTADGRFTIPKGEVERLISERKISATDLKLI